MYRLSPELLIAAAGTMVSMGLNAQHAFGERLDEETGARMVGDASWDVQFIERCGYWSHYDYRSRKSSWPFPRGMSLNELALYARANSVVHETPEWGDIFLQYSSHRREFVHAGIVLGETERGRYSQHRSFVGLYTIEGDTGTDSGLRGGTVRRVDRRLLPSHGDCFVRWTALPALASQDAGMAFLASILDARKAS